MMKTGKFLFFLLYFYNGFFKEAFFEIPNLTNAVVIIIGGLIFYRIFINRSMREFVIPVELLSLVIFVVIALFSGLIVAGNKSYVVHEAFVISKILIIFLLFILISQEEGQIDFVFVSMSITALIISCYALINGYYDPTSNKLSLGVNNNSNQFGYYVLFGILTFPIAIKKIRSQVFLSKFFVKKEVLYISSIMMYSVTLLAILESGSRTSLLACLVFTLIWSFSLFIQYWKKTTRLQVKKRSLFAIIILIAIPFVALLLVILKSDTFNNLLLIFTGSALSGRDILVTEAFQIFMKHPIFGVGIRNFQDFSIYGINSHNTVLEIIASTGFIGGMFYFFPYVSCMTRLIRRVQNYKFLKIDVELISMICIFIALFMTTVSMVHLYNFQAMITLGTLIVYENNTSKFKIKLKRKVNFN